MVETGSYRMNRIVDLNSMIHGLCNFDEIYIGLSMDFSDI